MLIYDVLYLRIIKLIQKLFKTVLFLMVIASFPSQSLAGWKTGVVAIGGGLVVKGFAKSCLKSTSCRAKGVEFATEFAISMLKKYGPTEAAKCFQSQACINSAIAMVANKASSSSVPAAIIGNKVVELHNSFELDADNYCQNGAVTLYRAVGAKEHKSTIGKQEYFLEAGNLGMLQKQFWLNLKDLNWFISTGILVKDTYVLTSNACFETISLAERFSDAGHTVVSFNAYNLKKLSHDAKKNGRY